MIMKKWKVLAAAAPESGEELVLTELTGRRGGFAGGRGMAQFVVWGVCGGIW